MVLVILGSLILIACIIYAILREPSSNIHNMDAAKELEEHLKKELEKENGI